MTGRPPEVEEITIDKKRGITNTEGIKCEEGNRTRQGGLIDSK